MNDHFTIFKGPVPIPAMTRWGRGILALAVIAAAGLGHATKQRPIW